MTGRIIRSKRCNARRPRTRPATTRLMAGPRLGRQALARAFGIVCAFALGGAPSGAAPALPKLPVIHTVGVVPLQWEGETKGLADGRAALATEFPKVVRDSRRFRVLGDDLIETLWSTADGRQELRGEFELNGFVGMTATVRGDTIQLTARLMDGWLKTHLLETDTVARSWVAAVDKGAVQDRLEKLVFRLFNRLPVDVSVTSVQGVYITLSGGAEQGIEAGDKVDLVRATVKSLHPANGTWLEFARSPLGHAQVLEVKSFTSVAKLVNQIRDGAVEVGDGARIPAIASRVKFARLAEDSGFKDAGEPDTIIVPPLYQGDQPKPAAAPQVAAPTPKPGLFDKPADPAPKPKLAEQAPAASPAEAPPAAEDQDASSEPAPAGDTGPSVWDQFTDEATSHRLLDDVTAYAGPTWWSVKSKDFSSSGKFPIYLLNSLGGGVSRTMLFKIKAAFGGGLVFGDTPAGSYFGYDGFARMYWEDELIVSDGLIKYWRAGGTARLNGVSVAAGHYGGGDWIRGGAFGALGGSLSIGEDSRRYDWFADYSVMPLNIGRVGYDNSFKAVESTFGTKLSLGAYRWEPARVLQWGGGFDYSDELQTLKNGKRPHYNEYSLKVLVKYGL